MFDSAFDLGYNSYTKLMMAMEEKIIVHPRVTERHPELAEEDVRHAWLNRVASRCGVEKGPEHVLAIGPDRRWRTMELAARWVGDNTSLVYHAFRPPTRKAMFELGLSERG